MKRYLDENGLKTVVSQIDTKYATKTDISNIEDQIPVISKEIDDLKNKKYSKPSTGIPESDLSDGVKEKLNKDSDLNLEVEGNPEEVTFVEKDDLDAIKTDVSVIKGRVDTFTTLPSGSTTGDAELIDIRIGADGTIYGNAGDAVRGQYSSLSESISEINEDLNDKTVHEILKSDDFGFEMYRTISAYGSISINDTTALSSYYEVKSGELYEFPTPSDSTITALHVAKFTEKNISSFIERINVNGKYFHVDDTTKYIRVLYGRASSTGIVISDTDIQKFVCNCYSSENYTVSIKNTDKVYKLEDKMNYLYSVNMTNGVVNTNGSYNDDGNYKTTDFIPCEDGCTFDVIAYLNNRLVNGVSFYDINKQYISGLSNVAHVGEKYNGTAPYGCKYIRLSIRVADQTEPYLKFNSSQLFGIIDELRKNTVSSLIGIFSASADNLSSKISISAPNSKMNNIIHLDCKVNTMGKVVIYNGVAIPYSSCQAEIDGTNIIVYSYGSGTKVAYGTHAHRLIIEDYLSITIHVKTTTTADIIISTKSGTFRKEDAYWLGGQTEVACIGEGGAYTDVNFTYQPVSANKDVWLFGDSYFDMWTRWAISWGYTNMLLDGYSGRNSQRGYESFEKYISFRKPKKIVWCLGMNDYDSNSEINNNWKNNVENISTWCDVNNVELILCTIPSTSSRNHSFKNTYIKSSGRRYVDVEKAVGADVTPNWYDGLQSADTVHPSEQGQKVIANCFIGTLPEICNY